jgi:hypothetical protein
MQTKVINDNPIEILVCLPMIRVQTMNDLVKLYKMMNELIYSKYKIMMYDQNL